MYRAMIYAGVAILHFYRDEISAFRAGETLGDFAERNQLVIDRMIEEVKSTFNYELSYHQVGKVLGAYVAAPSKLSTPVYIPDKALSF